MKSEDERNAIVFQFQSFLNSLDFSCQILIQSRRLNITGYIEGLKKLEKAQTEELMKMQTTEYRKFIESLVAQGTIMAKRFFVVVPLTIWEARGVKPKRSFLAATSKMKEEDFQECKTQLVQRVGFVALGLRRCGLEIVSLSSSEIIELFWDLHHPKEAEVGYYPEIPPELIK